MILGTGEKLLLDVLLKRRTLPLVFFAELFNVHQDDV
jgi:hypothetical protein